MKAHIACGTVYLEGYDNLDLDLDHHYLASDRSDLVEVNKTTIDNYYKENVTVDQFMSGTFHKKEVVCDQFAWADELPYEDYSVDEIVAMQLLEHFTFAEADELLIHWLKKLKRNGSVRIHVPDIEGIITQSSHGESMDWTIRQLYGSQKNEFGVHKSGYTYETLEKKLLDCGYGYTEYIKNINDYPAFGIRAFR